MYRKYLPVLLVLALSLSACGLHVNIPISITPGPTVTDQINLPLPAAGQTVDLSLAFGAGKLNLKPGASVLVSGTATYNVADFKPKVTSTGSTARVEQGEWNLRGIPDFNELKNEWDISLGSAPMNLTIEAGAYQADYQFGGLSLKNLTIKDGAAESKVDFSAANAVEMNLLRYDTGASNVSMTGLANANFASLEFNSGAGNYTLDFGGTLKRDGSIHVSSGVSNLTLVIPAGIPVQLTLEGISNVTHDSGWTENGSVYTQTGSGPQLTFVVSIGAGNLTITR
jgi:hypothetical protein